MDKQFVLLFKSDVCFIFREVTIHQVILQGFFETKNLATTSCFVSGKKQGFSITERQRKERAHMEADSLSQFSQ